jgi:hypothetical protein
LPVNLTEPSQERALLVLQEAQSNLVLREPLAERRLDRLRACEAAILFVSAKSLLGRRAECEHQQEIH